VDEGIELMEWVVRCYCGFVGNVYFSADVTLGKEKHSSCIALDLHSVLYIS